MKRDIALIITKCKECDKSIESLPGKRPKMFCGSTCRSNNWQKNKRVKKSEPRVEEPKVATVEKVFKKHKTDTSVEKQSFKPERLPGEKGIDYSIRLSEWEETQKIVKNG